MMYTFQIPVYWQVSAYMEIEADSLEEACQKANEAPLPSGDYIDGSFEVNEDCARDVNAGVIEEILVDKTPDEDLPLLMQKLKTNKGRAYLEKMLKTL